MPAIVEFPQVVAEAVEQFANLFENDCQRRHFAEYLTGLLVAQRKTVVGIHDEFARTTDQSCLNKFLTKVDWDADALNAQRLPWLQEDPATCYTRRGVLALDNVLIDHDGKTIEDVGWFWDHAEQRNKIAHDYLFSNFVAPSGKHYPLEFRRFKKRDQCEAKKIPFRNHTVLFLELVDWAVEREIPGDLVFDSYFTNAEILIRGLLMELNVNQVSVVIYERKYGSSKMNTLKTIFSHLKFMWRIWRGEVTVRSPVPR